MGRWISELGLKSITTSRSQRSNALESTSVTPFKTIGALRDSLLAGGNFPASYVERMLHPVPDLPVVKDRQAWLVEHSKGRVVLDIGCTGDVSKAIKESAKAWYPVDCVSIDGSEPIDVDHRPDLIPVHADVDLVICAEILEHLANPGYFLMALKEKYPVTEFIITVPHASCYNLINGCENVNGDHVAYYSYTTLKTLLRRYGMEITEARLYNVSGNKAEGLIVRAK